MSLEKTLQKEIEIMYKKDRKFGLAFPCHLAYTTRLPGYHNSWRVPVEDIIQKMSLEYKNCVFWYDVRIVEEGQYFNIIVRVFDCEYYLKRDHQSTIEKVEGTVKSEVFYDGKKLFSKVVN